MKNIFKKLLGLIVLFTLLFMFSCTEEFDAKNENDHQQNRNFEIKYKSFQQLMKEQKFNSAYKKVDQKIKTVKLASKTVMEEMYNFTIDTTVINEYHTSNYTSYNIGIIRDSLNNNYFENLFVEIDSSNVTTARILKYNINPINKLISSVETTPIIYNATNVTGKEAPGGEDCQTVSVYLQTQCGCPGHHWPGEGGCNCPNDPSTSTLLYSFTSCSSGGGGDVFDTGTLPSDPGTSILVTTTGGGSGSGSIAVPVVINYEKLRKNNLFKGTFFSLSERTWFFSQSEETQGAIMNYLESTLEDENGLILANVSEYSLEVKNIVKEAINDLMNNECAILPTVLDPSEITAPFDPNFFGDYPEPTVQPDHDAIQQQFNTLRNTSGNLAAVNYLISTYNMNTFGPNTININYSISFADGLTTGDSANAERVFTNGILTSCNLKIDTNLLSYSDFGYITRVIKHELYHVLQGEFYGQNGLSNAALEFDAYNSQIFRFNDLKKIQDMSLTDGLAKKMIENMKLMTNSEKIVREDKIIIVEETFPELCKD